MKLRRKHIIILVVAGHLIGFGTLGAVRWYQAYNVGKFAAVVPGRLYRSRQPTGRQWRVLEQYGITKVINLRTWGEGPEDFDDEKARCADAGVELVNIPIAGELPEYRDFERFIREVRSSPGPVLFHCWHGRNRTGFMAAGYLVVMEGWTAAAAMADLDSFGPNLDKTKGKRAALTEMLTRLENQRQQWLDRTAPPLGTQPVPSTGPTR